MKYKLLVMSCSGSVTYLPKKFTLEEIVVIYDLIISLKKTIYQGAEYQDLRWADKGDWKFFRVRRNLDAIYW